MLADSQVFPVVQEGLIRSCTFSCLFSFYAGNAGSFDGQGVAASAALAMSAAVGKKKGGGMTIIKQVVKREAEEAMETADKDEVATVVANEEIVKEETVATTATLQTDGQQIYIIQVRDQIRFANRNWKFLIVLLKSM